MAGGARATALSLTAPAAARDIRRASISASARRHPVNDSVRPGPDGCLEVPAAYTLRQEQIGYSLRPFGSKGHGLT